MSKKKTKLTTRKILLACMIVGLYLMWYSIGCVAIKIDSTPASIFGLGILLLMLKFIDEADNI